METWEQELEDMMASVGRPRIWSSGTRETWDQELEELSYLWDPNTGWTLLIYHTAMTSLKIVFAGDRPGVKEIVGLRKLMEQYRYLPPHELRDQIGNSSELKLGSFPPEQAQALITRGKEYDLHLIASDASYTSYLPTQEARNISCIISDGELAAKVAEKMIEAGAPVIEHQA
jgi:hypothetical protein